MKYTIEGFSQQYAASLQANAKINGKEKVEKLDFTDLVILRWFVDFYPNMRKTMIDDVQYAWVNYKALLADLPLLDISKHALYNRFQKFVLFGILVHKTIKTSEGTFAYYGFGENYHFLVSSHVEGIQINAYGVQKNEEGCAEKCTGGVQKNAYGCAEKCISNNPSTIDPSTTNPSTTVCKKESKPKSEYENIINGYTANEDLKEALWEFIKMRKLNKKPMTDRALKGIMNKLDTLASTDTDKIAILDQSITNSWQGVFPLKQNNGGNNNGFDSNGKNLAEVEAAFRECEFII